MTNLEVNKCRNMTVIKHNDLIQKARFDFTNQQQKILLYLISKIKPEQQSSEMLEFDILEFCNICGIDGDNGKNYSDVKKAILKIKNSSFWFDDGELSTTLSWIEKAKINSKQGIIKIKLDDDMKPFLLEIKQNFTQYSLLNTLGMQSKYSIRLYELLKSYQNLNETIIFTVENFQQQVGSSYDEWYDVKRKVIEPALAEINGHTDIKVSYEVEKKGRAVHKVLFVVDRVEDIQEKLQVNINQQTKLSK